MFTYQLSAAQIGRVVLMEEFVNGATQVSVRLRDGRIIPQVIISNSKWIVAIRGFENLPFELGDIADIFQSEEDKNPMNRSGWKFWDDWSK